MMYFLKAYSFLVAAPLLAWSLSVPNADTPVFYLVSSSSDPSSNLLPLRMNPALSGVTSLTGSGTPAGFYFNQGKLTIYDPNNNTFPYSPLINTLPGSGAGGCQNFGALVLVQGSSTNKCASSSSFQIQSNGQDSQLGAELVFNFVGGFYSCGQEVWYKVNASDGLSGCQSIHLWTIPVA